MDSAVECRTAGREIVWALQRHGHLKSQDTRLSQLVSAQALVRIRDALRRGGGRGSSEGSTRSGDGRPPRSSREKSNNRKRRSGRRRRDGSEDESSSSSSSSNNNNVDHNLDERFQNMFDEMCSGDWRKRKVALERLTVFVEKINVRSLSSRRLVSIFDQYNQRILDGNMKVSVAALESLSRVIPMFRGHLNNVVSVISMLVRSLTQQLGSTKSKIKDIALQALDTLIDNTSATSVCSELANVAKHSLNNHTRVIILERLCDILPAVYKAKSRQVKTCIVPVALKFLGEMRGPMEAVNTRLLCEIYRLIGKRLLETAKEICETSQCRKLMNILEGGSSGSNISKRSTSGRRRRY